MRSKFLSLIAVAALLGACETAPKDQNMGNTGGGAGGSPTTTTTGVRPGSAEDLQRVGDRVFFDYDKSALRTDGRGVLEKQAAWLKQFPTVAVTVEGHCDERGTREYNLALGERRANAVKDYLVALGIPANRIRTISYGKERPVAMGSNEQAYGQNRRGVTVVTGGAPTS
jgi:peptidoglycan-associated lipoprotein